MENKAEIYSELRQKGHRITPQREKILDLFYNLPEGDHLSAEDLQALLKDRGVNISLATLYRTLRFLSIHGLLRELDFGEDHKHYELNLGTEFHHHLVCNLCGTTQEFSDEGLVEAAKLIVSSKNNFKVLDYQFKIFGLCGNCQLKT